MTYEEIDYRVQAGVATSWFLPRLVGIDQALEWAYRGDVFPAV